MSFIDTLNFCLSLFGSYSLVLYLRYLLPRYKIPPLSTFLQETQQLLHRAEAIGAIPQDSEYSARLYLYADQPEISQSPCAYANLVWQTNLQ